MLTSLYRGLAGTLNPGKSNIFLISNLSLDPTSQTSPSSSSGSNMALP